MKSKAENYRQKYLEEIERDKTIQVNVKMTKRQLELLVDQVHTAISKYAISASNESDYDQSLIFWENKEDLQKLEETMWEMIGNLRGWKKI